MLGRVLWLSYWIGGIADRSRDNQKSQSQAELRSQRTKHSPRLPQGLKTIKGNQTWRAGAREIDDALQATSPPGRDDKELAHHAGHRTGAESFLRPTAKAPCAPSRYKSGLGGLW